MAQFHTRCRRNPEAGFQFGSALPDGNWTVTVTGGVPVDFTPTFDSDSGTASPNQSSTVNLVTSNLLQDFGCAGTASIGDRLWLDTDRDGVQDAGEPGVENVTITLAWYGPDGNPGGGDDVVLTTVTDDSGNYLFAGPPAGKFNVVVDTTDPDYPVGVSLTFDRDNGPVSPDGFTPVTLTSGANVRHVDFGVAGGGAIGDNVWFDHNGDGVTTIDEPGIGNVLVTLVYFGEDGIEGTLDDETFTDTTDTDGTYLFPGLPEGSFRVTVDPTTLPVGLRDQTFDANGPLDSTSVVALAPGAPVNLGQDFGYRGVGQIGDTEYFDRDRDGDGVRGADEPGLPGQSVTLVWNSPDGPRTFVTSTGPDGTHLFDRLPDGDFTVTVTGPIATIATNTGDPDTVDDSTSAVTLTGGSSNLDQDFGYRSDNRIGGRVWWDTVEVDTATLPAGVTIVADPDGNNDGRNMVTLTAGQRIDTVDFGVALRQGALPSTGGEIAGMLLLAGLLLALGAVIASGSRRRCTSNV